MATISEKGGDFSNPLYEQSGSETTKSVAILPPSAVLERSSPQIQIREFDVVTEDSGKDTQSLVTNDSQC